MKSRALLIRGHQGVGKTEISQALSENHNFCRISKDDYYDPIMTELGDHKTSSKLAYIAMHSTLRANARSGNSFVLDAPFNGALAAPALMQDLETWGFAAKSVLVVCSDHEEWARRLKLRENEDNPSHQLTTLEEIKHYRGTLEAEPFKGEFVIDSSGFAVDALAQQCVDHFNAITNC
ncbi:MAG TPA: ATP-binding protein [Candidatus Saccharimonadales bacterium]|nr:ATP-binding protein [Candidatus Saccharimonadales bacterium]